MIIRFSWIYTYKTKKNSHINCTFAYIIRRNKIMNVRNIVLTLCCLLMVIVLGSCSDSSAKSDITTNRNIPACGTTDPLSNNSWLSDFCKMHTTTDFTGITITISVYANKTSGVNHFVISYVSSDVVNFSSQEVYDCSGTKILFKAKEDPAPVGWNEFFAANENVATIWELKKK